MSQCLCSLISVNSHGLIKAPLEQVGGGACNETPPHDHQVRPFSQTTPTSLPGYHETGSTALLQEGTVVLVRQDITIPWQQEEGMVLIRKP